MVSLETVLGQGHVESLLCLLEDEFGVSKEECKELRLKIAAAVRDCLVRSGVTVIEDVEGLG